jgi:hypothetical protein
MKPTIDTHVWLSNPAYLATLDLTDAASLQHHANFVGGGIDMTSCGWIKLGMATITFDIAVDSEKAAGEAVKAILTRIEKIETNAAEEVATLREGLRRLQAITYEG